MSKVNETLIAFADDILKSAKRHLGGRKIGKNKNYGVATGTLKRSLNYRVRVRGNEIREISFGAKARRRNMLRSFILESTALARIKGLPIHTSSKTHPVNIEPL